MCDLCPLLRYRVRRQRHGSPWAVGYFDQFLGHRIPFPLRGAPMTGLLVDVSRETERWIELWFEDVRSDEGEED